MLRQYDDITPTFIVHILSERLVFQDIDLVTSVFRGKNCLMLPVCC